MVDDGYITKDQMIQAWKEGLTLKFVDQRHKIDDPHFVFYVKDYLTQKYGEDMVENGGLQVITTLDPDIQKIAQQAIDDHTDLIHRYGADNAAMVSLDPKNGQILAMVGSRDYWDQSINGQVNVTISPRQPGSSFKPLVYAAAIQNAGIGTGTYLDDYKTIFNQHDEPSDYDGKWLGHITIRQAIGGSRNIPAIKAFYVAGGEDKVLDFVDKLGVTNLREFRDAFNKDAIKHGWTFFFGWPMAIGSGEVRLLDLVNAYATFANQGKYNPPNPILEVRDRNGVLLESHYDPNANGGQQVIDPQVAYIITNILSDVSVRPPGSWRGLLTIDGQNLADKTGTSNKTVHNVELPNNDMTIGYTPSISAGFWVGNTDGKNLISNAYSLYTTDPIFHEFFQNVLKGKPSEDFPKPSGIKQIGHEYYPAWGGPKSFESMFKRDEATQQIIDVPLPDFLVNSPADVQAYQNTVKQIQQQQQQQTNMQQ
jgi:membrane peptidoglycan carboxypeptidase